MALSPKKASTSGIPMKPELVKISAKAESLLFEKHSLVVMIITRCNNRQIANASASVINVSISNSILNDLIITAGLVIQSKNVDNFLVKSASIISFFVKI